MFQFPRFASQSYVFRLRYRKCGGFSHSEIHGSKSDRIYPWLIAAYYVLHRLLMSRHPPNALFALDFLKVREQMNCSLLSLITYSLIKSMSLKSVFSHSYEQEIWINLIYDLQEPLAKTPEKRRLS